MGDTVPVGAPLAGRRVVTTRGGGADERLAALLRVAGARVVVWPTCEYPAPLDPAPLVTALAGLDRFDWVVFTSARAAEAVSTATGADRPVAVDPSVRSETPGASGSPTSSTPESDGSVSVRAELPPEGGAAPAGPTVRSESSSASGSPTSSTADPDGSASVEREAAPAAGAAPSSPSGPGALPRVAVVGPATARAATMAGWSVAVEGRGPGARGLAAQVAATVPLAGARVLFPAASGAAPTVEEEFTAVGARVTRVEAYRTVVTPPPAAVVRADLAAGVDAVTFASPAAVEALDRALGGAADAAPPGDAARALAEGEAGSAPEARGRTPGRPGDPGPAGEMARALAGVVVVCIGPTTGTALARRGVAGVRVAATATLEGMVEALVAGLRGEGGGASSDGGGRSDAGVGRDGSRGGGRSDAVVGRVGPRGGGRSDAVVGRVGRCPGGRTDAVVRWVGHRPGGRFDAAMGRVGRRPGGRSDAIAGRSSPRAARLPGGRP